MMQAEYPTAEQLPRYAGATRRSRTRVRQAVRCRMTAMLIDAIFRTADFKKAGLTVDQRYTATTSSLTVGGRPADEKLAQRAVLRAERG